jgi:phenylacetate-CoA ligase
LGLYSLTRSALWKVSGFPGDRYKRFLSRSEHWSRDRMVEYRDEKLRELVRHCYENVPYYRREMEARRLTPADIRCAADLAKLPILTKAAIRKHPADLLARSVSPRALSWSTTGGTTGEPIRVAKTRECRAWESMCFERGLEWGGLGFDRPRVRIVGGSLGLGRPRLLSLLAKLLRPDVFVPVLELRPAKAPGFIAAIRKSGLRFAVGYASALYSLAVLVEKLGEHLRFTAVFPTAEVLQPEWDTAIRRVFQCAVLPFYGCGEVNSLAYSRADGSAYYIPEEHVLVEVVTDGTNTTMSGDGAFVVTDLVNYAMPLLRYVNGDAGKLSGPDGGGLPFSRIERLDGRCNSFLMTDNGDLIPGTGWATIFQTLGAIQTFQVVQEEPRRIVIKVVTTGEYTEAIELKIIELFKRYLGEAMRIEIEKVASIPIPPSGKAVYAINRCLDEPKSLIGVK